MPVRTTEWLNFNRYRRYPFIEDDPIVDDTGVLALPDDCVVDAYYVAYTEAANPQLRLHQVAVDGSGASVTFTFRTGTAIDYVMVVPASLDPTYEGRVRTTIGASLLTLLRVMFARGVADVAANPTYQGNTYTFSSKLLEPAVTSRQAANRIELINGYGGPIYFADGTNTRITLVESTNVLRVVCAVGAGMGISCEDPPGGEQGCDESIYYVNGRHPDWLGRFAVRGGSGITVDADPDNHKLTIKSGFDKDRPGCKDPPKDA
jgi:hypothetical protein